MPGSSKLPPRIPGFANALFLALTIGCGTFGCTTLGGGGASSPGEVEGLKRRVVDLQRRATASEIEVARLKAEISALEKELQTARSASADRDQPRESSASQSRRVATEPVERAERPLIVEEVDAVPIELASGIEETELEEPPRPPADVSGQDDAHDGQGTEAEGGTTVKDTAVPPPPKGRSPEVPSAAAIAQYDEGYTLFHRQRYEEAEAVFRRYLTDFPDSELADNAQFWLGECRYARNDFEGALRAFTRTIEEHPQGNKVADALLKAGKCLEALGRREQARQTYHEVTDRFPSSAAAVAARERLAANP